MDIQTLIGSFASFINTTLIPFILTIAFLVFIWKIVEFSVIGAANEESREKARSQAMWSLFAFVIIISFWGIVNLFTSSIGLENQPVVLPDYMKMNESNSPAPAESPSSFGLPTECVPPLVSVNGNCVPPPTSPITSPIPQIGPPN